MASGIADTRQRAIELFQQKVTQTDIAARLGVSRVTVNHWAKIYGDGGAEALLQRPEKGRARRLTEDQRRAVTSWLAASPRDQGLAARRWTGRELATLIRSRFGVVHSPTYCLALCRAIGVPIGGAYRPPRTPKRPRTGLAGRPAKVSGVSAYNLRRDLLLADANRGSEGWTLREVVDFIRGHSGVVYAPSSIAALLGRLDVALQVIPERQRRIETRPRVAQWRQRGRRLTAEQLTDLYALLKAEKGIGTWSAERVATFIMERFRVSYAPSYVPLLLQDLGILIRRSPSTKSRAAAKPRLKGEPLASVTNGASVISREAGLQVVHRDRKR